MNKNISQQLTLPYHKCSSVFTAVRQCGGVTSGIMLCVLLEISLLEFDFQAIIGFLVID